MKNYERFLHETKHTFVRKKKKKDETISFSRIHDPYYIWLNIVLPKTRRHHISDIWQAKQHKWNAEDGVKNGHHFSIFCFRRDVTVSYSKKQYFYLKNGKLCLKRKKKWEKCGSS